jgi:hypothetical protein
MNKGSGGPPSEEEKKPEDEILRAQLASEEEITLFDKIVKKEIPANIIYEDTMVSYMHSAIYSLGTRLQRCETRGTLALPGYPKEQDGTHWNQEGYPRSCWAPWPPAICGESCGVEGPASHRGL